jgi:hypothetical protein
MGIYPEKNGLTLLAGASDPDGNPIVVSRVNGSAANVGQPVALTGGAGGLVTVNAAGVVSFDDTGLAAPAVGQGAAAGSFTYRLSDGVAESPDYTVTVSVFGVTLTAPASTAAPAVSGTPQIGQALNATAGTWTGAASLAWSWQRNGTDIAGASGTGPAVLPYTLVAADDLAAIRVRVTATNSAGSASATSAAVTALRAPPQASGTVPAQSYTQGAAITALALSGYFGGGGGLTFALAPTSAALPAGLTLASNGTLSGTPTATVSGAAIVVRASNSGGFADQGFSLTVAAAGGAIAQGFGALTLAGAGGIALPPGATAIAGGTATGYTVAGGHVVPSSAGSAGSGTMTFTGSAETWTITALANAYSVRSDAERSAITGLSDATLSGKALHFRPGDYAAFNFTGRAPASGFTFRSHGTGANRGRIVLAALGNAITHSNNTKVDWDGVVFRYTPPAAASIDQIVVLAQNTTECDYRNCLFESTGSNGFGNSIDGTGSGFGLDMRGGDLCIVEDCTFRLFANGVSVGSNPNVDTSRITFRRNLIEHWRQDALKLNFGAQVIDNTIRDNWPAIGQGDHGDCIQLSQQGNPNPSPKHILLQGNVISMGPIGDCQGIFMRNEDSEGNNLQADADPKAYADIVITDNVVAADDIHGISVGKTNGLTITRNTILYVNPAANPPGINPTYDASEDVNVTITGNVTPGFHAQLAAYAPANTVLGRASYAANFINHLDDSRDAPDYYYRPGNTLSLGVTAGSTKLLLPPAPASLTAIIASSVSNGTYTLDAQYSADASGVMSTRATYAWSSDTGWSATGASVSHAFPGGVTHAITLTVTRASDGAVATSTMILPVPVQVFMQVEVDGAGTAIVDTGPSALVPIAASTTSVVVSDATRGAVFDTSSAKRVFFNGTQTNSFFSAKAVLTIAIWTRLSAAGMLVARFGQFEFGCGASGILTAKLTYTDGSGAYAVNGTTTSALLNNAWHKVHFVYDGGAGLMRGYVDGTKTLEFACPLTTLLRTISANLQIGDYDFVNGATGLLDSATFIAYAMSAAEVAADQG